MTATMTLRLPLSDWLKGVRWAWRRWNCVEGKSDKSPLHLFCRVALQIPLQQHNRLVANLLGTCCGLGDKSVTSWQFPRLREVMGKLV